MSGAEGLSPALWTRVHDAVLAELLDSGIDRFTIDGVARRAGLDSEFLRARWHDRRVLLMDVMLARTAEAKWTPDTGSLHTDLEAVAALALDISQTARGRATFRRTLPGGPDIDLAEISSDLWSARFRDAAKVLQRAGERGQLRDGVVPEEAIRMFAAAFYYDVIFADTPVRPEYAEQVVEIFLHGVLGAGGRDRPWGDVDQLVRLRGAGQGASAADQALEVAHRALVLARAWADALIDPLVMMETVRDDHGHVVDFVYRDVNRAAFEEMGLSRAQMVGQSVTQSSPYFGSSGLLDLYARCAESGEPVVLNDHQYQHFDEHRRVDIRATNAGFELIAVTWRIVTDRYEAAQREARYRKLMDSSPIPVGLTTADGHFIWVNRAMVTMTGYGVATLATMRLQDLTAPDVLAREAEALPDELAGVLAGRCDTYRAVKRCVHADGHLFEAELLLGCVRNDEGEVENLIAQIVDRGAERAEGASGA